MRWRANSSERQLLGKPFGIGLIIIEKCLAAVFFLVVAVVLFILYSRGVTHPFQSIFSEELQEDPHDILANFLIARFPGVSERLLLELSIGALAYFILEAIEGIGLLAGKYWVEILIVVETAAFLPFEIYELTRHFRWLKIVTMIINLLILWYLIQRYLNLRRERRLDRLDL